MKDRHLARFNSLSGGPTSKQCAGLALSGRIGSFTTAASETARVTRSGSSPSN